MKILFILPEIHSPCIWNVGIASMSAVLKKAGHQVDLFEIANLKQQLIELLNKIKESQPDVIGISVNSHQFPYSRKIARAIKEACQIPIFLGGIHAVLFPKLLEEEALFDGVCLGEGEEAFLELVDRLQSGRDYFDTQNFWFRRGDKIIKNERGRLIENLNELPFPDRSIFQYFRKYQQAEIRPRFIFSRGCPFNCTYCCNHALRQGYAGLGKYLRFRSVDKAIEEIIGLKKDYKFRHIKLDDDTFSLNKNWLLEFCQKFPRVFSDLSFECNIRPGTADKESLAALKEAHCDLIKVGVETGSEYLRKKVLNRQINNQDIIDLFKTAKAVGLKTFSFNMVGIPGETKETIKETINLNVQLQPDFMQVSIFYPYYGTDLGDSCAKEGLIGSNEVDSYMAESVLKLPTISKKEIEKAAENFKFNVYKQYDMKKAISVKKEQIKDAIISQPCFKFFARPLYRLLKS